MEKVVSIKLSYKNTERKDYQLLAEFLRLAGVYVYENNETVDSRYTPGTEMDDICTCNYGIEPGQFGGMGEYSSILHMKEDLNPYLEGSALGECYEELAEIFTRCKLLEAGISLQYFRTVTENNDLKNILNQAGKSFEDAIDEIDALINKPEGSFANNFHVRYARTFCKQKVNLARYLCQRSVLYYVDDLAVEGLALIKDFPDFSNGWVLLGFIYEIAPTYTRDAIDAFQRALKQEGNKRYMYSVYYWMGKRCEEYHFLEAETDHIYRKAYEYMPKYRNIYKVAKIEFRKKNWDEALRWFDECLNYLNGKQGYLDPLELEYCFKINIHMSYIYLQLKDYYSMISYAKAAEDFWDTIDAGKSARNDYTAFCFDMYTEPQKIVELTLLKMDKKQAYRYLAKAYGEISMPEQAGHYFELAEK